ncbi:hypothetical protein DRO69_06750 [Candidatus Bathyarchaeota archaeon]|nr:MAG: hypothetical protein DRO69_06750 [Candidatus Bathyarchaeota archaeon]
MSEKKKLNVRLDRELEEKFFQIKKFFGVENETEVVRSLINWFWREHEKELQPKFEHFNVNENGVLIVDREQDRIFQVYFHPEGIECECGTPNCKHKEFALSLPKVQQILREKGWKPA